MTPHTIQISGLPESTNEEAVREFFSRVGDVASCTLQGTTATLAFHNADDFNEALNMDGVEFEDGAPIQVTKADDGEAEEEAENGKTSDAPDGNENGADAVADAPSDAAATARENRKRYPEEFKIAIRQLPDGTTELQLRELFEPLGTIGDLFIHPTRNYAFIGFDNADSLDAAIQMSGRELNGVAIEVEKKRTGGRDAKGNGNNNRGAVSDSKVVVKGLPPSTTEDTLRSFFAPAGEVVDLFIHNSKSFAFVGFSNEGGCEAALRMSGAEMDGHPLHVERRQRQRCFKCNKEGHVAVQCRAMEPTCRSCGRPGHMARDCRANQHVDHRREERFDRRREERPDRREERFERREEKYARREDRRRPRSRSNSYDRHRRRSRSRGSRSPRRHARHERSRSRSPVRRRY